MALNTKIEELKKRREQIAQGGGEKANAHFFAGSEAEYPKEFKITNIARLYRQYHISRFA